VRGRCDRARIHHTQGMNGERNNPDTEDDMTRTLITSMAALSLLTLVACDQFAQPDITGDWEIELTDADHCLITMELEQDGDELEGEADVECRIFFTYDGESYYYDVDARGVDLEGELDLDRMDFEIDLEFYDDFFDENIEITLEGEVDGDQMEGDAEVFGDDWGEFEGELD